MNDFKHRYGPWALVAGGARGIGEAYSRFAAARGLSVIVVDHHEASLAAFAEELRSTYDVDCLPLALDLAAEDLLEQVVQRVGQREVGLVVYNAGLADVGPFFKPDTGLNFERQRIAVNVTGPLVLTYHFARPMLARRRGGIVLMSSGAGLNGAPYYAAYAATKAYDIVLGESLWREFRPYEVDVLAVAAGMTLSTAAEGFSHLDTSSFQTPTQLVEEAMAALGQVPLVIAGEAHREGRGVMAQLSGEQVIELLADHAIQNFFDGEEPEQTL